MKIRLLFLSLLALVVLVVAARSCASRLTGTPAAIWTPAPLAAGEGRSTPGGAILPATAETQRDVSALPGETAVPAPLFSTPVATAQSMPVASATPSANQVTITEADVLRAVTAGAAAQGGLVLDAPSIRFLDGKMQLAAGRLQYGTIEVRDLVLIGRLVAQDGRLQLETESISPRGLVTALIPSFANQALAQYAAQWYVEEVRTLDGRLELGIR